MVMHMSEVEILGKFRRADDKKEVVQILSELNACSYAEMKEYLVEHGIPAEEIPVKRGRKKMVSAVANKCENAGQIPEPVIELAKKRIGELTEKVKELETERDCLCDFLSMHTKKAKETG